jgi:hypothetical protein
MGEARLCWLLYGIVALGVLVTYSRISPDELYHVSRGGLWGGLSRALVFMNYPTALMAIAVLALLATRGTTPIWWVSFACCLVILAPGVVDEGDLDAKWINLVPAAGVLIALVLTQRAGLGVPGDRHGDRLRIAFGAALAVLSIPWIFAELGFHVGSPVFLTSKIYKDGHAAVHLGEHHGFESLLLIVTALLLSRQLSRMRRPTLLAVYLSLMIAYGLGNIANDAWKEQVVKRGWTSWEIPTVLRPGFTWMWGLILLVGAGIYLACFRRARAS